MLVCSRTLLTRPAAAAQLTGGSGGKAGANFFSLRVDPVTSVRGEPLKLEVEHGVSVAFRNGQHLDDRAHSALTSGDIEASVDYVITSPESGGDRIQHAEQFPLRQLDLGIPQTPVAFYRHALSIGSRRTLMPRTVR